MPRKARNYAAEYAKRNALAKARGYRSYGDQRRKIETGRAPAINPGRIRTKRTADAQQEYRNLPWEKRVDPTQIKIEMAQEWSRVYARTGAIRFDSAEARRNPHYLSTYLQAFVLGTHDDPNLNRLTGSDALYEYLVNETGYMSADEYETRYGANTAR